VRLIGAAQVRNEADIVEAFVRHNLSRLDGLLVIDHRSDDGTRDILAALARDGLPLALTLDDDPAQRQPENITRLAREAFAQGADCVLPLDADEFLKIPDRAAFERTLSSLPPDVCAALEWQTYVPEPCADAAHPLAAARRRRAAEAHGLYKVVLTRAFAQAPAAVVGPGNHTVLMMGARQDVARTPVRLARLPSAVAALAHFPVRSIDQLVRKIEIGWAAHCAAARSDPTLAFHWRELHEEIATHGAPTPQRLAEIAVNYGLPMARWRPVAAIPMIEDPLPVGSAARYG
jgi:hypothetical protein